jgi:FtsP/CotA-like multicopper oxidase with cupredoxin domain
MNKKFLLSFFTLALLTLAIPWGIEQAQALPQPLTPGVDYTKPNYAYSPTTIKKFVDSLPNVNTANNLTQQIPLAVAGTFPGLPNDDYYEIGLVEYFEQMHTNLPSSGTKLRGYVQIIPCGGEAVPLTTVNGLSKNVTDALGNPVCGKTRPHYLGPLILATKNRAVRIKFSNLLPTGTAGSVNGKLFLPVDDSIMGAGMGPKTAGGADCDPSILNATCASYTQNRATIHLHGGLPPWISDGTAHQWITPAGEVTPFVKGASQQNVPDMWFNPATHAAVAAGTAGATNDPGPGSATFYWPNQQSGRLMFYHDHALGLTGLNVYAGEAAGYLLTDPTEEAALLAASVPGTIVTNSTTGAIQSADLAHLIPLVIQDKSFVSTTTTTTDPLWDTTNWGGLGNLWFPHVYMPNQDPAALSGANPLGRWDYGPWFWPVFPVASPYPPLVSHVPEAFMDTPVVNGTAYPHVNVDPTKYRLRILNAANDRMLNLQLYVADPAGHAINASGADVTPGTGFGTEVKMVAATPGTVCTTPTSNTPAGCFPPSWTAQTPGMIPDILDSRPGGIPDPTLRGPAMIQIGTEGGVLPGPALLLNSPVGYEQNKRNIVVLNVLEKTLFMAPAERADVIVDFSKFAGKTVILYNDSPAPVPASDPRYDFYTGNPDMSATAGANNQGGPPSTVAGFGPNTRTIMQFRVGAGADSTAPIDDYNTTLLSNLTTALPTIFKASQDAPVVPESVYNDLAYTGGSTADTFARIQNLDLTFTPYGTTTPTTIHMKNPTIQELFDPQGRMNATLGVELPFTGALIQTTVPLGFKDPTTETIAPNQTQLWKITHNGVDTHGIHFHLVNVQVINRVGWDGAIRTTDPNELGWKDTVRMNPLEDIIVAMRAKVPTVPFTVPNSIRLLDVTMPVNSSFASLDPLTGAPITVTNAMTNFGHEYTWHCHILGHEENDMMRPFVLNPNAKTDILWRNSSTGANLVWFMDGVTVAGSNDLPSISNTNWKIVGTGDFNNDTKPDILWRNTSTGENVVWYMDGVNVAGSIDLPTIGNTNWTIVGTGDFNNDTKTDILWRNTSTGQNVIWYMNGVTVSGSNDLPAISNTNWTIAGTGDFNSDSKPDILWRNISTGDNVIWYMDGITVSGADNVPANTNLDWQIVGIGDFNSDVKPDILWRNITTGENMVWYMNGVTNTGTAVLQSVSNTNWKIVGK